MTNLHDRSLKPLNHVLLLISVGLSITPYLIMKVLLLSRELFAGLLTLPNGSLLDHYVDVQPGRPPTFRAWADVVPGFEQPVGGSRQQLLVPTVDTVRIASLVEARFAVYLIPDP